MLQACTDSHGSLLTSLSLLKYNIAGSHGLHGYNIDICSKLGLMIALYAYEPTADNSWSHTTGYFKGYLGTFPAVSEATKSNYFSQEAGPSPSLIGTTKTAILSQTVILRLGYSGDWFDESELNFFGLRTRQDV